MIVIEGLGAYIFVALLGLILCGIALAGIKFLELMDLLADKIRGSIG